MNKIQKKIAIIDLCVTKTSPAGSCVRLQIISLLKTNNYKIDLYTSECDLPYHEDLCLIQIKAKSKILFFRYLLFFLKCIFRVKDGYDLIQSTQGQYIYSDIVYAHFCHKSYLKNQWKNSNVHGFRKIFRYINHKFLSLCETIAIRNCNLLIVPSKGLYTEILEFHPVSKDKIEILHNPIILFEYLSPFNFNKDLAREKIGFNSTDFVIVFSALGDFARKGLDIILDGINEIKNENLKLLVVGGSKTEITNYETKVQRLNIEKQVIFTGFQNDVKNYFWASDLFVLLSTYEIFPLVTIQAAASGLPILSTKIYGVEEYLVDGINGWFVKRDKDDFIKKINLLKNDHALLIESAKKMRESIEVYSSDKFSEKWINIYSFLFNKY